MKPNVIESYYQSTTMLLLLIHELKSSILENDHMNEIT
jgi:hypothetical protein